MNKDQMPIGFSMALAQNPKAMQTFCMLSENEKQKIIEGTHQIQSRNEMHRYVENIITSH